MADRWHEILCAARRVFPRKTPFTAAHLAAAANLRDAAKSNKIKMAYGWLSKFLRWGYVERAGTISDPEGREMQAYRMTDVGIDCEIREGRESKIKRHSQAVKDYKKAIGTRSEEASLSALVKLCEEIKAIERGGRRRTPAS